MMIELKSALRAVVIGLMSFLSAPLAASPAALRFSAVVTGQGSTLPDTVVIIDAGRIVGIQPGVAAVPSGTEEIDLRPLTALPGLIDVHTHMTFAWDASRGTRPWEQYGTLGSAVTVYLARTNAIRTLEAGVTTVRDLGATAGDDFAMRDLIARGEMAGPRMLVSGCGLYTSLDPAARTDDPCRADGVAEVQRAARRQIAAGADWIKLFASTGSGDDVTGYQSFSFDEIKAAVEVAHRAGKKVAVHSYGPDGARDAVRAGADSIEHAIDIDDATLRDMARRNIFYIPTVDHNRYYAENHTLFGYDSAAIERLNAFRDRNLATLRRAIKFHVPIAMGSDAVFTAFGANSRELSWFVTAGMTPAQAIASATRDAARLLGQQDITGFIAVGSTADIIAVAGNPLQDITKIQNVRWVMKGGVVAVDKR